MTTRFGPDEEFQAAQERLSKERRQREVQALETQQRRYDALKESHERARHAEIRHAHEPLRPEARRSAPWEDPIQRMEKIALKEEAPEAKKRNDDKQKHNDAIWQMRYGDDSPRLPQHVHVERVTLQKRLDAKNEAQELRDIDRYYSELYDRQQRQQEHDHARRDRFDRNESRSTRDGEVTDRKASTIQREQTDRRSREVDINRRRAAVDEILAERKADRDRGGRGGL